MATDTNREHLQAVGESNDSKQPGCTSWLFISCIVLTFTTAFVFGWGLAAPNMYNSYTEPFLKGSSPCQKEAASKKLNVINAEDTTTDIQHLLVKRDDEEAEIVEGDENDDAAVVTNPAGDQATASTTKAKDSFDFYTELKNGIPQTIFLIGAFLGALTSPFWAKAFDRKRTVFANYIFCFASSLTILLSYYKGYRFLFYISRLLLGYQGGLACVLVPPYINEIAARSVRGAAGAAFQLALTIGILVAQVVGLPFIAGSCTGWGWGLSIVFLLPLAGLFPLFLLPNSPAQMLIKYDDEVQARTDLQKLRGTPNVQNELDTIRQEARETGTKSESLSIPQVLKSKRYRWPMLTTVILQFSQALSGINAVFFYSSKMFEKAGIPHHLIPYANIGTGLINVIATVVAISLIEKLGRRPLVLYPMALMVVVFGVLTALVQINETRNSPTIGLVTVVFILIFIVCFAVGLGPIPFLYGGEVCRQEARDSVQSLGLVANYFGNILLSLFFPALNSIMGGYVFLIFLVLVLINLIFLWKQMPETRDKKIEEIEKHWGITQKTGEDALPLKATTATA